MVKSLDPNTEKSQRVKLPPVIRPVAGKSVFSGKLPLMPGEIILTPDEEHKLTEATGWQPGQPLPGDIAERLAAVYGKDSKTVMVANKALRAQKAIKASVYTTKPPQNLPPFVPPDVVDISQCDEEKQRQLREYIGEFENLAPQIEAAQRSRSAQAGMTPEVQKALQDAGQGVTVTDSRITDLQRRIDEAEGKVRSDPHALEEDEEDVGEMPSGEGVVTPTECHHCGHDPRGASADPSVEDKLNYVQAVLGAQRFQKQYVLLGGQLSITFHRLTTEQSEEVLRRVAREVRTGLIGEELSVRQALLYRMLMALEDIQVATQSYPMKGLVSVAMSDTKQGDSYLPALLHHAQETEPLNNELVWRLCRKAYDDFNELTETLEARAFQSDFWNAIGG